VRITTEKRLKEFGQSYPKARKSLDKWLQVARAATWENIHQVRKTFSHADAVKVRSGKTATVFNVCGHAYRLVTAIHYDVRRIYVMLFMTHEEYAQGGWKASL